MQGKSVEILCFLRLFLCVQTPPWRLNCHVDRMGDISLFAVCRGRPVCLPFVVRGLHILPLAKEGQFVYWYFYIPPLWGRGGGPLAVEEIVFNSRCFQISLPALPYSLFEQEGESFN
jgi:hypothetical protein